VVPLGTLTRKLANAPTQVDTIAVRAGGDGKLLRSTMMIPIVPAIANEPNTPTIDKQRYGLRGCIDPLQSSFTTKNALPGMLGSSLRSTPG
jgi:hypothetical protein